MFQPFSHKITILSSSYFNLFSIKSQPFLLKGSFAVVTTELKCLSKHETNKLKCRQITAGSYEQDNFFFQLGVTVMLLLRLSHDKTIGSERLN